jgi:tetratricopeptide (TPR) repeat protein
MKTLRFLSLFLLVPLMGGWVHAQATTNSPAAAKPHVADVPQPGMAASVPAPASTPSAPLDPAKITEYQNRFNEGYALQQAGKLTDARAVYDGILAEQPEAKRSLLEAGRISLKLNQLDKAEGYLLKLHMLAPNFPEATELLIQTEQALKHDEQVATLITGFQNLHDSGQVPGFSQSPNFVREQVRLDSGEVVIFTQYFDYMQKPNFVWQGQLVGPDGTLKRQLNLFYDPQAAKDVAQKDPKLTNAAQFILVEDVIKDGRISQIDAYFQMFAKPDYAKVRGAMLGILNGTYKPVYSQPIAAPPTTR